MRATLDFLYNIYDEFNRTIFSSSLPAIEIRLSNGVHVLGCLCRTHVRNVPNTLSYTISISSRYDFPRSMLEDILIHEMIHYKIAHDGEPDTSTHGRRFKMLMSQINETFGRNVKVRISLPESIRESDRHLSANYIFTCRIRERDKFMRCASTRIFEINSAMARCRDIEGTKVYFSNSPLFNRFSRSRTLRFYEMTDDVRHELASSSELVIKDGTLHMKNEGAV